VRGPALSRSGYGEHVRFLLRSLHRFYPNQFDLYVDNTAWGHCGEVNNLETDLHWILELINKTDHLRVTNQKLDFDLALQVTIPGEFEKLARVNIGITAGVETTKISPQWLMKCNEMDKVITISEFAKSSFISSIYDSQTPNGSIIKEALKLLVDIDVVHYPARQLKPKAIELELEHDFNFITIAQMSPRKKLRQLIKGFVDEFYNDEVGLVIKTMARNNSHGDRAGTAEVLKAFLKGSESRKCSITLIHGEMTEEEFFGLYVHPKIKAFVNISGGEGFGLPLFEAAQFGLPIVAIPWSGHVDFLFKKETKTRTSPSGKKKKFSKMVPLFTPVNFDLKQVEPEAVWKTVVEEDSKWAFADNSSLRKCYRDVLDHHDAKLATAKILQGHILENFEEEGQMKKFVDAIFSADSLSDGSWEPQDDDWEASLEEVETL